MGAIRETLKGLTAISGRHRIFFEADPARVLVSVLHDRMDYGRHLEASEPEGDE